MDRIIGLVTTAMRLHDITDPETFERLCQESFKEEKHKTACRKVEQMIGITDYEKLFDSKEANKEQQIKYLHTASKFMLIRDKTGKKVHLYYKHDSREPGWLPKPVQVTNSYNVTWKLFTKGKMAPKQIVSYAPVKDEINGRAWKYDVLDKAGNWLFLTMFLN